MRKHRREQSRRHEGKAEVLKVLTKKKKITSRPYDLEEQKPIILIQRKGRIGREADEFRDINDNVGLSFSAILP